MARYSISIVVPAYCEAENLRALLPRLRSVLDLLGETYEILVIDTMNPKDDTSAVCIANSVKYFNRSGGDRYGDAVRTGIGLAQGDFAIFMDADGSHSPETIPTLYRFRNDYDVIIASRYVPGGNTENGLLLILMSRLVNLVYSVVLGLNIHDASNSFRLYRTETLRGLALYSGNFDIIEEMLYKIRRTSLAFRVLEVPATFKERMYDRTKRNLLAFIFSFLFTLIRLRFGK